MTATNPQLEHDARCAIWNSSDVDDVCTCRDEMGHAPDRSWADGPLLAFDLETTAPDPLEARVVTATVIQIVPRKAPLATNWLADPGVDIPDEAAQIHGITTEHARAHGRPVAEVVDQVCGALQFAWSNGVPVVGHNVSYDLTVLATESARYALEEFAVTGPVLDTIVLDRGVDRYRKGKRTLTATCAVYGVTLTDGDAHSSDADALASARIAWKIAKRYPEIGAMALADLQDWQRDRHRAWADNFGAYLTKQGKRDDVSRDWPVRGAS